MGKRYNYFRISIVALLFIMICRIFYLDFAERHSISFDDIVAVILFLFGLRVVLTKSMNGQYLVLAIILMSVVSIIKGNIILNGSNYSTFSTSVTVGALSANGVGLLLFVIYCLINWSGLKDGFRWLRNGSEKERKADEDKMVAFYYERFSNTSSDELLKAVNIFESYPREAQIALNKVKSERGV